MDRLQDTETNLFWAIRIRTFYSFGEKNSYSDEKLLFPPVTSPGTMGTTLLSQSVQPRSTPSALQTSTGTKDMRLVALDAETGLVEAIATALPNTLVMSFLTCRRHITSGGAPFGMLAMMTGLG